MKFKKSNPETGTPDGPSPSFRRWKLSKKARGSRPAELGVNTAFNLAVLGGPPRVTISVTRCKYSQHKFITLYVQERSS